MLAVLLSVVASPCTQVEVDAIVSEALDAVRGTVTCEVAESGKLYVATYPRILREPLGLNDVNSTWFYPEGFEPADMILRRRGTMIEGDGPFQSLGGAEAGDRVTVDFETRVPLRNGTFGRRDGILRLLGGWHPAFGDVRYLGPSRYRYRIQVPAGAVGLAGDHPYDRNAPRLRRGELDGVFVPLLVAPAAHIETAGTATIIHPLPRRRRSVRGQADWHLRDLAADLDGPATERLALTLYQGQRLARRYGVPEGKMMVVVGPLRERLAETFDGGIAVSDRAFHLLPFETLLKFHRLSIWRVQLAQLILPLARARPSTLPPELIADAVGTTLRDRLMVERYSIKEFAPDLLETWAFIPEVDSLIFAPQTTFIDTYFEAIDESVARRWRLDDFHHTAPRGKLIHEKLVDRYGLATVDAIADSFLASGEDYVELASHITDADIEDVLAPYLGGYPRMDYRLGEVYHASDRVVVEVEVSGPDAHLVEPITVEIEDDQGEVHRQQRMGPGRVGFDAPGPPGRVQIDPQGRLPELVHEDGEGPKLNNRDPSRWRFLLNNLFGLVSVVDGQLQAGINFNLRRIHDLTWHFNFFASGSPDAVGGGASVSYAFGPEITPLRTGHRLTFGGAYERLLKGGPNVLAGDQGLVFLAYGHDNRLSNQFAFNGWGVGARVIGVYGVDTASVTHPYVQGGVSAFVIFPLGFQAGLLLRGRGDVQLGDPAPQNLLHVGDRDIGGRGFERGEVRGRERLIGSAELRHILSADHRTDLVAAVFHRFEGGLFADVVYLPNERSACPDAFVDVGYGFRFIGDLMNVQPASVQIDVGVPLNRCADERDRFPVTVWLAFTQSFARF